MQQSLYKTHVDSPVGILEITGDENYITSLTFADAYSSPCRGEARRGAKEAHRYPLPHILENVRELRKNMTSAERLLWKFLRGKQLGVKFRKQHPVGKYVADFACLEAKLIIELDGGQHSNEAHKHYDKIRTDFLQQQCFKVLRFWNNDVLQNTEGVFETIYHTINQATFRPHPNPPPTGEGTAPLPSGEGFEPAHVTECKKQLSEYFSGKRKDFDLPLAPQGTEFQMRVWKALRALPFGRTASYGDIARRIRKEKASRAVGMANNRNPLAIIVPCHRVVGSNGALTGYAGGLWRKEWLLTHEKSGS